MIAEYSVTLENKTKTELILFIKELQDMLKEKDELYHKALGDLVKADRENIKKDKIIYEMIGSFIDLGFGFEYCNNNDRCINDCDKCIKQYFERKATNNG